MNLMKANNLVNTLSTCNCCLFESVLKHAVLKTASMLAFAHIILAGSRISGSRR